MISLVNCLKFKLMYFSEKVRTAQISGKANQCTNLGWFGPYVCAVWNFS